MKLRLPVDCEAASHAGKKIEISREEVVEVGESIKKILMSHGFVPITDELEMSERVEVKHDECAALCTEC